MFVQLAYFTEITRSSAARENGTQTVQVRDVDIGQELYNGTNKCHMRNARRTKTIYVRIFHTRVVNKLYIL